MFITDSGDAGTLAKIKESGAVGILKKPFKPAALLAKVGMILGKRPGAAERMAGETR
jgi:DNA-binding response OmpR family regulator